jgi:hypothetical protein
MNWIKELLCFHKFRKSEYRWITKEMDFDIFFCKKCHYMKLKKTKE